MTSVHTRHSQLPSSKTSRVVTPAASTWEARYTAPPINLSFKHISNLETDSSDWSEELRRAPKSLRRTQDGKYASVSLKLNNNLIQDWKGFHKFVTSLLADPTELTWLDLSFNYLVTIDDVINEFTNLKILYLHGNGVEDLKEIDKLAALPKLMSLTLHGNPMDGEKGYRHYVLTKIPQLRALDFSRVTKADRETARTMISFMGCGRRKEKKRKRPKTF